MFSNLFTLSLYAFSNAYSHINSRERLAYLATPDSIDVNIHENGENLEDLSENKIERRLEIFT